MCEYTGPDDALYAEAEATIESANISAIEHLFLLTLLDDAVKPHEFCQFILDQVSNGAQSGISVEDIWDQAGFALVG